MRQYKIFFTKTAIFCEIRHTVRKIVKFLIFLKKSIEIPHEICYYIYV